MSRTYRRHLVSEYKIRGIIYDDKSVWDIVKEYDKVYGWQGGWHCSSNHYVVKKGRDKKPWHKPNREFKKMHRRLERAQVKNAIRSGIEALPMFKKSDVWNWT